MRVLLKILMLMVLATGFALTASAQKDKPPPKPPPPVIKPGEKPKEDKPKKPNSELVAGYVISYKE